MWGWNDFAVKKLRLELKDAFARVKEELDEHLDAINDNTAELQANYEYLQKLDEKIEKLNEKFEAIQLSLSDKPESQDIKLTKRERDVFQVLYLAGNEKTLLNYRDIAKKLGISELLVRNYITNLIEKNVPIVKRYVDKDVFLALEGEFRELQARKGIVQTETH